MREMEWKKGFKPRNPDFYCSLGIFGFSSKLPFCHYTLKFCLYDYSKVFRRSGFIFNVILT